MRLKISQLGITNVGTIKEGEEIEKGKEGQEMAIHLSEKLLGLLLGVDFIGSVLVKRDCLLIIDLLDGGGLDRVGRVLNVGLHVEGRSNNE